jgi:membrane fusion protein, heavy metal efflux system
MSSNSTTAEVPYEGCVSQASSLSSPVAARPSYRRWYLIACCTSVFFASAALIYWFHQPILAILVAEAPKKVSLEEPLTVVGKNRIAIASSTPLNGRLKIAEVKRENLEFPLLTVTGYVMARMAPGTENANSRWEFGSPEVATAYADWLHARADVIVLQSQASKTRQLVEIQTAFLKEELERKENGYAKGAIPQRDLVAAKAEYLKADLQGQKDITDAESSLKKSERNRSLLEHQLLQAGVDPEVVRKTAEGLVLIVAEVPEAKVGLVKVNQPCEAQFFGVPGHVYHGRVGRLGPSVAKEKRTLRVTFELTSPGDKLLPGMFAEIGLGVELRKILTVPVEAVLRAENADYVMKEESTGQFLAVKVTVDEPRFVTHANSTNGPSVHCIPVVDGLQEGERVVGAGAILLKPFLVKALAHQ